MAPLLVLLTVYLLGLFLDLGSAITKADGLDQSLSLAAAAASTQVSATDFYQDGLVVLNSAAARDAAISQLDATIPKNAVLAALPQVKVLAGSVCIRASELISMPFALIPGTSQQITYSASSSAIAKGSGTNVAPQC